MPKNYLIILFTFFIFNVTFTQENVLCPIQNLFIFFEDIDNIPDATENSDDTYTLTFNQPNITDIFSNYTLYNFEKTYSGTSPNAIRTYTVFYDTNNLIKDLLTQVSENYLLILESENSPSTLPTATPIDASIITALHDKTFNVIK